MWRLRWGTIEGPASSAQEMSDHSGTHDVGKNGVFEYEGEDHQLVHHAAVGM